MGTFFCYLLEAFCMYLSKGKHITLTKFVGHDLNVAPLCNQRKEALSLAVCPLSGLLLLDLN